jgi:hypothetical protein
METEHQVTVVDKVTAYVKDLLGIPQGGASMGEKPEYEEIISALHFGDNSPWPSATAPEPTIVGAMRIEPITETTKGAALIDPEDVELMRGAH